MVRSTASAEKRVALSSRGVTPVLVDYDDPAALQRACEGAACVVSALNGLEAVIIGAQGRLLDAAVAADVPRFIPSDYRPTSRLSLPRVRRPGSTASSP